MESKSPLHEDGDSWRCRKSADFGDMVVENFPFLCIHNLSNSNLCMPLPIQLTGVDIDDVEGSKLMKACLCDFSSCISSVSIESWFPVTMSNVSAQRSMKREHVGPGKSRFGSRHC